MFLNIDFRLKKAEPLMEAGQIVAYAQLAVKEKKCCGHCAENMAKAATAKLLTILFILFFIVSLCFCVGLNSDSHAKGERFASWRL